MSDKWNVFGNDVVGVIKTPGATLGRLTEEKNWVPVFLLLVVIVAIFTYIVFPMQMAKMAEDPKFAEIMGEEQAAYFVDQSTTSRMMGVFLSLFGMFLSIVFGAFFLYLFYGIGGSDGLYGNYFSLVTNASIIDVLFPTILNGVSMLTSLNIASVATPFLLFLSPDPQSIDFLALSRLNVFSIWYIVAVAAAMSVFSRMSFKKSIFIAVLYFIFKAVVGIASSYVLIKITEA
jgi:hypothetical protein